MRNMPPLLSKAAAIALTVFALLLMYLMLVSPVTRRLSALDEQIDQERLFLGRFVDLIETANVDTASDGVTLKSLNFVILTGHTEQIKAASLQARITKAADNVGLRLASLAGVFRARRGRCAGGRCRRAIPIGSAAASRAAARS